MLYSIRVAVGPAKFASRYFGGFRLLRCSDPAAHLLGLPFYQQLDFHSCGFLAALTVLSDRFHDIDHREVLTVVQPRLTRGVDEVALVETLNRFGVQACHGPISFESLLQAVENDRRVIVTTERKKGRPHWAPVAGITRKRGGRIYLTNSGPWAAWQGLSFDQFRTRWAGDGIVCG